MSDDTGDTVIGHTPHAPGSVIDPNDDTVVRGAEPVRLARLHTAPFTDRLVRKFDLPVSGWRGDS